MATRYVCGPPPSPPPPLPLDCNACDAGAACAMCLVLIPAAECPPEAAIVALPACSAALALTELCEASGECSTKTGADNCEGGYDVYRRVSCYPAHAAADA